MSKFRQDLKPAPLTQNISTVLPAHMVFKMRKHCDAQKITISSLCKRWLI